MLYAPILCAVVSAGAFNTRFVLFLISTTAAFFLREPLETWIRLRMRGVRDDRVLYNRRWSILFLVVALVSGAVLVFTWKLWLLPAFGAGFVLMLVLHGYWIYRKVDRRLYAEIAAVIAMTSSAAACRYAVTGLVDQFSWLLWVLNALFFVSSVFRVRSRVSQFSKHKNNAAKIFSIAYHTALAAVLAALYLMSKLSWSVPLAFVPVIVGSLVSLTPSRKLNLTRIGFTEVAFTIAFLFLMFISFR